MFFIWEGWTFCKVHVIVSSWSTKPGWKIWGVPGYQTKSGTSGVAFLKLLCYDEWLLRDSCFYLRHLWEALTLPLQTCFVPIMGTGCIPITLLGLLDMCLSSSPLPPQKVEGEKKWYWDKLEKMVLVFSNSRNLLCISMANWISVSAWGAPRSYHIGEISLCFEMHFEATQYRSCSHPVVQLLKAALFVSHCSLMVLFWDLSGTFITAISF